MRDLDDVQKRIESVMLGRVGGADTRQAIAQEIMRVTCIAALYDELDRLDAEVSELDDERCDFDCNECQDGNPVSLAAQHLPPEALT